MSDSLRHYGLEPTRLPRPWNSPGKNTGVGCHALLQGTFLTQGCYPRLLCLLHWQAGWKPVLLFKKKFRDKMGLRFVAYSMLKPENVVRF